ncbi:NAD-dependent deacylase [Nocardioides sp.]|uniref:NAD-dependent deacylase n=1 Tax=Nocardioides sp. TaxID=35761 RepID=UPI002B26BC6D|nr:NAD-dependent deacylase [Nocardioides sp.]
MRIVILTGAGVSAESGVPTFRDADGLWEGHHVEDVATPEAFERQPGVVHRFYDERRAALSLVDPNPAHVALSRLQAAWADDVFLVTQNIDDLHERGGSVHVHHMHGELRSALCRGCGDHVRWLTDLADYPPCPGCHATELRPDVVWFGEIPYGMDLIQMQLQRCDLFVSIGTSGAVYPAAGFVQFAAAHGARTLELNLDRSEGTSLFDEARHGPAGRLVPAWVDELLADISG